MKKILYLVCPGLLLLSSLCNAQEIQEGKVKIGKTEMPGFTALSKYDHEAVEAALNARLAEAGIKTHAKKKKIYTYNGVLLPAVSPTKIDMYFKVQKKKKKSVVLFVVSKGYDNYVSSGSDATATANIKNFLGGIDADIAHKEAVKDKEKEIEKANKELEKQKEEAKQAEEEKNKKAQELEEMKKRK